MNFGDGPKGNKFAHAGIGENNVDSGGEAVYTPTDVKKRGDLISARTSRSTVSRDYRNRRVWLSNRAITFRLRG